jgi:hypothetical protein
LYRNIPNLPFLHFNITILGKDDGFHEWRENLKGVLKKTSLTVNQNVLFLYDTQMIADDRYVEVHVIPTTHLYIFRLGTQLLHHSRN